MFPQQICLWCGCGGGHLLEQ